MVRLGEVGVGIPKGLALKDKCGAREVGKHTHGSFGKTEVTRASEPGERVCVGTTGGVGVKSPRGARCGLVFTDSFSRYCKGYATKLKPETLPCLKACDKGVVVERPDFKLLCLRGGGGEFDNTVPRSGVASVESSRSSQGRVPHSRVV